MVLQSGVKIQDIQVNPPGSVGVSLHMSLSFSNILKIHGVVLITVIYNILKSKNLIIIIVFRLLAQQISL